VNAVAPGVLGRAAREHGALLVHYSTDYVFNGSGDRPWTETDVPAPLSVYGESKLRGEQAIRESGCLHLILRTSWVYAARGSNFLRTILRAALKQRTLRVVCDQIGAPTGAELIADVTARILPSAALDSQRCGTYHLAAAGATSWHEYASYVVERARACGWPVLAEASSIEAIPTDAYPTAARRPSNSRLDCQVLTRTFGVHLPDWRCGVDRVLTELRLRETQGP
jgi:dTDP-4-dehydrorhamnose reductase